MTTPAPNYGLKEIADILGMSERWVSDRCKAGAKHQKLGHKIKMTAEEIELLRAEHTVAPPPVQPMTTKRKKRAS